MQSTKYVCDSCGIDIKEGEQCDFSVSSDGLSEETMEYDEDQFDLCKDCYKKVLQSLKDYNLLSKPVSYE